MNRSFQAFFFTLVFIFIVTRLVVADFYPGLSTRSQNPLLQSYFIPAVPLTSQNKWTLSESLYITNTYQLDDNSHEELIIDTENTRFDFQVTYAHKLWYFNINASLISNRSGFLDQTIESWHDFFGMPQGGRNQTTNNNTHFLYLKNGDSIVDTQQPNEGLGDIQLATGYQLNNASQLWFALEIPTSSASQFISNDAIDAAVWFSGTTQSSEKLSSYGTIGLALPANSGLLKNHINDYFLFAQLGIIYAFDPMYHIILQIDSHSEIVNNSRLAALEDSYQGQFGLRFPKLFEQFQLELFFSEDIFPGHAPDITFGLRVSPSFN